MKIVAFTSKSDKEVNNLKELYLPCPRSNRRSVYFHNVKGQLYEIQKVTGPGRKSSWLIDSNIHKDGAVRFITIMDPLFMALPILEQASKDDKFKTLDDIFSRENVKIDVVVEDEFDDMSEEYSKPIDVHRLTNIPGFTEQLGHLCDVKEIAPKLFVYKLNQGFALNWLAKKIGAILSSASFKKVFDKTKSAEEQDDLIKLEAVYTLSNYLNKEWFNRLLNKLEISERKEELGDITNYVTDVSPMGYFKRVHPDENMLDSAPAKVVFTYKQPNNYNLLEGLPILNPQKKKAEVPRSLAKVNTRGMKSLTSFFTPTPKK